MQTRFEQKRTGCYLLSEAPGTYSRDLGFLGPITEPLQPGQVLGRQYGADITPKVGQVGGGTVTLQKIGAHIKAGAYTLTCTALTGGGVFAVTAPDGARLADAQVGVPYDSPALAFTIAAAGAAFAVNDAFTITVAQGYFGPIDPAATNGLQVARGILYEGEMPMADPRPVVLHVRDCEVRAGDLEGLTPTTADQLRGMGIIVRTED
jgi:hypothetical protein